MQILKFLFLPEPKNVLNFVAIISIFIMMSGSSLITTPSIILPLNPNIQYIGRIDFGHPDAPEIWWAGSGISANFQGTSIKIILSNPNEVSHYFNVIIDGNISLLTLPAFSIDSTYLLAAALSKTVHTLQIIKREFPWNKQVFKGLILDDGSELELPSPRKKRKIEFYGDSITQGAQSDVAVDSADNDENFINDNNFHSYASITARAFDAEYSCIAISGIRLTPTKERSNLPSICDRLYGNTIAPLWDFSKWQADVVVVNLGQNDYPFPQTFTTAYINFIQKLRSKYPNTEIFLLTGTMSAGRNIKIINAINKAVKTINAKGDKKVYAYNFIKNDSLTGHPRISEHQASANELIAKIKTVIWGDSVFLK